MTRKKPHEDDFLADLKAAVRKVIHDEHTSKRDINAAVANGAKLLVIEHKINPAEADDFFG